MRTFSSITFKYTAGVFLIVTLVTLSLIVAGYAHDKRAIENRLYAQLNAIADLKKEMVVRFLAEKTNDLKVLSSSPSQRKNLSTLLDPGRDNLSKKTAREQLQRRLESFKNAYLGYAGLEIVDLNGVVLASTEQGGDGRGVPPLPGGGAAARPGVEALGRGDTLFLQQGVSEGRLDIVSGMPPDEGPVRALVVGHLSLADTIVPFFSDYTGLGRTGETLLLRNAEGRLLFVTPTRYPEDAVSNPADGGSEHMKLSALAVAGNEGLDTAVDYRGKEVIGAYRYIPSLGWGLVTKIDADEAFSEIQRLRRNTFLLSLAVLAVMLGLAYMTGRQLASPLSELIRNTKMITAGHFSKLKKSGRTDEIGELEDNFNEMVIALDAARHQAGLKREDLERKVNERTESLARANAALLQTLEDLRRESEEKKSLQAQLLHAQKMEAVGTLAGGVAHDFNNILTAIIGYGSVMRMKLRDGDPHRGYLDQILAASERAANLTRGLLAFSRRQIANPQPVRMNDIVERVRGLLAQLMGESIELRVNLDGSDPVVFADAGQLEQVVMNLATNARDAMPDGGCFTLSTEIAEIDERYISLHGYGEAGKYAVLTARDTGTGMDRKTLARIFEPFFTTKETGKGTGLGLSIAYGIIKAQRGYIDCTSEPGKGAAFRIYLPLTRAEAAAANAPDSKPPRGGKETVLLAEDSAEVRELTTTVLTDFGYKVIEAADGEEAVRKFRENPDAVDLLVLDVIMPVRNGKDVYDEIAALRPGIKAVFTSGYTADVISERVLLDRGLTLLTKPVTPVDLLEKIREVLDG